MTNLNTKLFIIDPQNDFVDPHGSLYVTGAERDAERLANLIEKTHTQISDIILSLDSHHRLDISHPLWFHDQNGEPPQPFTLISSDDLKSGRWSCAPTAQARTLTYLETLEAHQRYPHVIWPEHCLIGSEGHGVFPIIYEAIQEWAHRPAHIQFVRKGENPWTEHFSAVKAEVSDPSDPHTQVNLSLIEQLNQADQVWIAGWARSHCVGNTVRDLIRYGGPQLTQKLILVSDTMSDVPGFEEVGEVFLREACSAGVRVFNCNDLMTP